MKVYLKCFSELAESGNCNFSESKTYRLNDGQTVGDLVQLAGIDRQDVKISFVNNRKSDFDSVLSNGDRVGLAPAVGGM